MRSKVRKPKHVAPDVKMTTGQLIGMTFTVEDCTPVESNHIVVKYRAPNNGPKAIVKLRTVDGEVPYEDAVQAVQAAFAVLLPFAIGWHPKTGYTVRTSGQKLLWDPYVARFVPK